MKKRLNQFAIFVTNSVSTIEFFLIIVLWTVVWLTWNIIAPVQLRFDPYPGFVLWLFMSNMIQIFLMPLILIGQDIQSKNAEGVNKAHNEFTEKMEKMMEDQLEEILKIMKKK